MMRDLTVIATSQMCIRTSLEIQEFFETYKRLEPHKWVKFKEWRNAEGAASIATDSMSKYQEMRELYGK